jgi:hypothetical protein
MQVMQDNTQKIIWVNERLNERLNLLKHVPCRSDDPYRLL